MAEYIYILSNPSMYGLLKIGKTTKSPNKRMIELHSTGVPTPFVLEFAAEVDDCSYSERAIHEALDDYRVSKNREFFKIEIKKALQIALEVVGEYEIYYSSNNCNIQKIREKVQRNIEVKKEKARIESARWLEERIIVKKQKEDELALLNLKIQDAQKKLNALGDYPKKYEPNFIEIIVLFPCNSVVLSYLLFISPLFLIAFVSKDNIIFAGLGVAWLAASIFHEGNINKINSDYKKKIEPFDKNQEMINIFTNKMKALKKEIETLSSH